MVGSVYVCVCVQHSQHYNFSSTKLSQHKLESILVQPAVQASVGKARKRGFSSATTLLASNAEPGVHLAGITGGFEQCAVSACGLSGQA